MFCGGNYQGLGHLRQTHRVYLVRRCKCARLWIEADLTSGAEKVSVPRVLQTLISDDAVFTRLREFRFLASFRVDHLGVESVRSTLVRLPDLRALDPPGLWPVSLGEPET